MPLERLRRSGKVRRRAPSQETWPRSSAIRPSRKRVAHMTNRIRGALPVAVAIAAVSAPSAGAAPVSVNLRVEGASSTIFDGRVTTDGHSISTASSGGAHLCDGTNNGAYPASVPTATAALDDGARLNGLTWDADWFADTLND